MDTPDCTEFIIYCSAIWLCKFSLASFSLILRILFCQFSFSFQHLCSQNQACWHVQFPKFAIEVFFLWNFANHLKVRDFANSAFIQTLCFCIPLLFYSRLFVINKQALFAYYSQSGHKDCAKYVAEICQQLLQISASHLVFEKSK